MDFTMNIWVVLFMIIASQGLLIGLLVSLRANQFRWLGAAVLTYSILLFYYVAFWSGTLQALPSWIGLLMGCPYIIAAFIVMQCCKFPPGKILRLLIPFFLFVSFYLTSQLINMPPWAHGLQASLQCAVMLAFGVYAFSYAANSLNKRISLLFLAYTIAHTSYYLMIWMNELTIGRDYFVSLTGAAFMYGAAYLSFFYREPAKQEPLQLKLRNMLIERIEEGKLYLDNELRLPVLAEATGFSTHQISELINSGGENFADLINKYRVDEAKKLLSDPSSGHMTTEEVGYASGFNNKTSFYKHFKKDTGLSPMKYRMKHAQWITEN